jgi:hypothetical protein
VTAVTKVWGTCHVAFGDTWQTAAQTWTDITPYLREFTVGWGRSGEYNAYRAGTLSAVLDNRDGRFTPDYTSSPYSPNVKPWAPIKVGVTFTDGSNTTVQCLFSGFVERWILSYPGIGTDAICQIQATDGLKIPANYQLGGGSTGVFDLASTSPGGQIGRILDGFGWSTGALWRTVDAGGVTSLSSSTGNKDVTALSLINTVMLSDGGFFYSMPHTTAHTPRLIFRDRLWPQENNSIVATFGETSTCVPYQDIDLSDDEERIRNRWKIGITASTKIARSDSTDSQDSYGLRVYSQTGLLLKTTAAADDRALAGVHTTAQPSLSGTVTSLLRKGMDYDRAVDLAVDAYMPLRWVTVKRGTINEDMIVDACQVSFKVGQPCEFTYSLSPASLAGTYWILGDADMGKLDMTTYLGW